ncbi:MAG: response regulator [Bacteriovoracaceae bacterium]|nr:response regulator [Bacteriovoracaceae bacterium]
MNSKSKKIVLIVDDEPDICEILEFFIHRMGYQVEVAYTGDEALSKSNLKSYDLVITDMVMPGMSGKKFIQRLRETPDFKAKIVISSGQTDHFVEIDYDDILAKPFTPEKIEELFKKVF